MRRFFALFHNELIRISRKKVVLVMSILLVAATLGVGALIKSTSAAVDNFFGWQITDEELNNQITMYQTAAETAENNLKTRLEALQNPNYNPENEQILSSYDPLDIQNIASEWQFNLCEVYHLSAIKEVDGYYEKYYLETALYHRAQLLALKTVIESNLWSDFPALLEEYKALRETEIPMIEKELPLLDRLMESTSYADFVTWQKENLKNNFLPESELQSQLEMLDLRLKMDPDGKYFGDYTLDRFLQTKKSYERALEKGIVTDKASIRYQQKLTEEEKEDIRDQLRIIDYSIENGIFDPSSDESSLSTVTSFGMLIVALAVLILASSAVSQEIATGSVKSLIIAPCKRSKIFLAKLAALVFVGLIGAVAVWLLTLLTRILFFGIADAVPHLFIIGNTVHAMPYAIFLLFAVLLDFIEIIAYILFALMLSAVTRNTAVATGVTIGVFSIGSLITSIISLFASPEVQKFIPFNHFDLSSRIFSSREIILGADPFDSLFGEMTTTTAPSLLFSFVYLGVLFFTLAWISYDSFTRRDI